jgi:hypothetical protein
VLEQDPGQDRVQDKELPQVKDLVLLKDLAQEPSNDLQHSHQHGHQHNHAPERVIRVPLAAINVVRVLPETVNVANKVVQAKQDQEHQGVHRVDLAQVALVAAVVVVDVN